MRLIELIGQNVKWQQPRIMKMEYELRADDRVVANLRFRSAFSSFATAECADGTWTFKRIGLWHPKVTIHSRGENTNLAIFVNNSWSGGGTLELSDERKYPAKTNFWASQLEFQTEMGEPLVSYRKIGGLLHLSSEIEIAPFAKGVISELPWIVLLGWYLHVMMHNDASAGVAATMG